jgi:DivIVA domain-containing protein
VASQGQRFRRRALRRGYKVDEVDDFLDRVEATLAGESNGVPVSSQEVHDVVFRVRFGGYDEWQVDLHLDRAERQLAELEERGGHGGQEPRMPDRMTPPDRMGGPDPRMAPPDRMGAPDPRMAAPDRMGMGGPDPRMAPPDRMGAPDPRMAPPDRMGPPDPRTGPIRDDRGVPPAAQPLPPRPMPAQAGPQPAPYGRYEEPTGGFGPYDAPRGGYEPPRGAGGPGGSRGPGGPGAGFGPDDRFDGFEAGRHGKADMTAEIRLPERDLRVPGRPAGPGVPPMAPPPMAAPPAGNPPMGPPPGIGGPGADLQRVDQIRRSFQVRRFGSGYDPEQVNRLFEGILASMSGRGPMPVNPAELDSLRFGFVPGGYFEAEVDAALKEVKDILLRR